MSHRDPKHLATHTMHPFEAMAEPVRRRIVDILASGEHTSGQLAEVIGTEFKISRTAVSKHLRILRDSGLVDVRAELAWRWYRLAPDAVEQLELAVADLRWKWERRAGWDPDLRQKCDPLAGFDLPVRRRGVGRPIVRGRRGRQTEIPVASDPERGLFTVRPLPPEPAQQPESAPTPSSRF